VTTRTVRRTRSTSTIRLKCSPQVWQSFVEYLREKSAPQLCRKQLGEATSALEALFGSVNDTVREAVLVARGRVGAEVLIETCRAGLDSKSGKKLVSAENIDVTLLARIIERGLAKDGRLVRLRIHSLDHPGALVRLSTVIAEQKVNIVETLFNRSYYGVVLGDTAIDITMETRGPEHIGELTAALDAAGYTHERVL
jgi:hypothetical protein